MAESPPTTRPLPQIVTQTRPHPRDSLHHHVKTDAFRDREGENSKMSFVHAASYFPPCTSCHRNNQSCISAEEASGPTFLPSSSSRPIRNRVPLRGLALLLFGTFVLVAVAVGVSKIRAKPTLHVVFPAADVVRKVRMFSDFPDLSRLSKNHSSLSLVSRLQLLDTKRCRDQLQACKMSIVCDLATDQGVNCRCRAGYYYREWKCHECSNQCPQGQYLVSSCSTDADAICQPCSPCGKTQYEAAPCSTHRDTICVDVSFPVGILSMKRSHLPDDRLRISVRHSPNVFLERLADMTALDTPMYVTNNQQSLHFVWPRASGLDIGVHVTGVLLVPDYRDVDSQDDTELFQKLPYPSSSAKQNYTYAQNNFCRHPIPDYYSLQLIQQNRTGSARVVRCDSTDSSVPACPPQYKDGDRYLQWDVNTACPKLRPPEEENLQPLEPHVNRIDCTEETPLLRQVFDKQKPPALEYLFHTEDCDNHKKRCKKCLDTSPCKEGIRIRNYTELSLHDSRCCGLSCYSQAFCVRAFSPDCPEPTVECARGELDMISLFPHFPTIEKQFACHLRYAPPTQLYSLSYTVRVPSIGLNVSEKHFTVSATSRKDHERRLSRFDFIQAVHDTRFPVREELILLGDFFELAFHNNSMMKKFSVRPLKTSEELASRTSYSHDSQRQMTFVQFERPFLHSSSTWMQGGCQKNVSQIYPNQTIYSKKGMPVTAKKSKEIFSRSEPSTKEFRYQMYHTDREPFIKFFVDGGESVLQHLQGTSVHGILVPSSLYGRVTWHHDSSSWQLLFAGRQLNCPTVISLKIFTQMMTGCAGHFDILINCPEDFTVTFNLTTAVSDLPDVFVLQANDSRTSHNLVLSSLYSPIYVDELGGRSQVELNRKLDKGGTRRRGEDDQSEARGSQFIVRVWWPLLVVVIVAIVLLMIIYCCYCFINANITRLEYKASTLPRYSSANAAHASVGAANSSANSATGPGANGEPPIVVVALNNQGEKANHVTTTTTTITTSKDKSSDFSKNSKTKAGESKGDIKGPKLLIIVFVVLYVIYSLVFSFSLTFGALYLTQCQVWSNVSNPENLAQELQVEVDRSLAEIRKFENAEQDRIFSSFLERRRACVNHLEMENSRLLEDYDVTMRKQLRAIFVQNGTLHLFTAQIQRQNVSAYIRQINQFLEDCNKTVHSIVDRFEANYFQFLRSTALNDWLEVPRQIFLFQDGKDIDSTSLSSTQIKRFASWIQIDKVEELLKARENVFGRLSSVSRPEVTTLDMTFPSAHPGPPITAPSAIFDSEYQTFSYLPLDPPTPVPDMDVPKLNVSTLPDAPDPVAAFTALKSRPSLLARYRRDESENGSRSDRRSNGRNGYDSFGLSGSLKANPDSSEFSGEFSAVKGTASRVIAESNTGEISVVAPKVDAEDAEFDRTIDYDYDDEVDDLAESDENVSKNGGYMSGYSTSHVTKIDVSSEEHREPSALHLANGRADFPAQGLKTETEIVNIETVPLDLRRSNLITDNHKQAARYDTVPVAADSEQSQKESEEEGGSGSERWLYVLVAVFLTLDVVLWAYRLSWLSRQLHAARHGYADRIPTDDACKQVIEIQTAYHLPAFDSSGTAAAHDDSSSGYYVDGKEHSIYASDLSTAGGGSGVREPSDNMTFLQTTLPRSREDSILQKIWQQKMSKAEMSKQDGGAGERGSSSRRGCSSLWDAFCAGLQRLFLSHLIWQATVTFLAIILLCLLVHCASFWLTAEHFRVLVGAQSAVSDVQWQLHASDHHLRTLAKTLSLQLRRLQGLCDAEVDALTSVFFDTVNMQTSMFTSLLQELCREAKGENCDSLSAHLSTGGRIVGCSFLPLQARTYHDLSLTQLEAVLAREVTPLLEISRRLLALSACVVALLLCARLVCQAAASTARHFLLLRGYLPRVRVYQAEETHNAMLMSGRSGAGASTLQRSQSWVDSCESGVYVCEADDGGMNNSGTGSGAVAASTSPPTAPAKEDLVVVQPAR